MGGACDGPEQIGLPEPEEGGGARSTPLEAAPAAERLEKMDTEYRELSGELVVEVREFLQGDCDLDLTIRTRDECGDAREVCNEAFELAARPSAPEEMSSDAVSDPPAGAALGHPRAVLWTDEETSGDGREVRVEIISNARAMVDAGSAADTPIDARADASRDITVAAPRLELAEILTNQADGISSPDAPPALECELPDPISEDALRDAGVDGAAEGGGFWHCDRAEDTAQTLHAGPSPLSRVVSWPPRPGVKPESDGISSSDAPPALEFGLPDPISEDALRDAGLDGAAECGGCEPVAETHKTSAVVSADDDVADEGTGGPTDQHAARGRRGALDPVRLRAGTRSELSLTSHARFLQYVFRRSQSRAEMTTGLRCAWTRGGLAPYFPMMRPVHAYRCHSSGVAGETEFEAQACRARAVIAWYACYVRVLARLTERTPAVLSGFCGAGGTDEGVRRAGAVSHGIDLLEQPDYVARFGEEHFTRGDARDECSWRDAEARCRPFLRAASPPCQPFSTGRKGEPSQPALIAETRGLLERRGLLWWMENVLGAVHEMSGNSTVLRGAWFGLHVDRGRRFETNFPVHVDAALMSGEELRARTCLGGRRRWLRLDPFGRPVRTACCAGNLFAVQGSNPTRSSVAENAYAMGVDPSHMRWAGLAQAIPPAYAELLVGQAAMHECWNKYGVPRMTYDEYVADPMGARAACRRGCGARERPRRTRASS